MDIRTDKNNSQLNLLEFHKVSRENYNELLSENQALRRKLHIKDSEIACLKNQLLKANGNFQMIHINSDSTHIVNNNDLSVGYNNTDSNAKKYDKRASLDCSRSRNFPSTGAEILANRYTCESSLKRRNFYNDLPQFSKDLIKSIENLEKKSSLIRNPYNSGSNSNIINIKESNNSVNVRPYEKKQREYNSSLNSQGSLPQKQNIKSVDASEKQSKTSEPLHGTSESNDYDTSNLSSHSKPIINNAIIHKYAKTLAEMKKRILDQSEIIKSLRSKNNSLEQRMDQISQENKNLKNHCKLMKTETEKRIGQIYDMVRTKASAIEKIYKKLKELITIPRTGKLSTSLKSKIRSILNFAKQDHLLKSVAEEKDSKQEPEDMENFEIDGIKVNIEQSEIQNIDNTKSFYIKSPNVSRLGQVNKRNMQNSTLPVQNSSKVLPINKGFNSELDEYITKSFQEGVNFDDLFADPRLSNLQQFMKK